MWFDWLEHIFTKSCFCDCVQSKSCSIQDRVKKAGASISDALEVEKVYKVQTTLVTTAAIENVSVPVIQASASNAVEGKACGTGTLSFTTKLGASDSVDNLIVEDPVSVANGETAIELDAVSEIDGLSSEVPATTADVNTASGTESPTITTKLDVSKSEDDVIVEDPVSAADRETAIELEDVSETDVLTSEVPATTADVNTASGTESPTITTKLDVSKSVDDVIVENPVSAADRETAIERDAVSEIDGLSSEVPATTAADDTASGTERHTITTDVSDNVNDLIVENILSAFDAETAIKFEDVSETDVLTSEVPATTADVSTASGTESPTITTKLDVSKSVDDLIVEDDVSAAMGETASELAYEFVPNSEEEDDMFPVPHYPASIFVVLIKYEVK